MVIVSIGLFDLDQHAFPKQHEFNLPFQRIVIKCSRNIHMSSESRSIKGFTNGTIFMRIIAIGMLPDMRTVANEILLSFIRRCRDS